MAGGVLPTCIASSPEGSSIGVGRAPSPDARTADEADDTVDDGLVMGAVASLGDARPEAATEISLGGAARRGSMGRRQSGALLTRALLAFRSRARRSRLASGTDMRRRCETAAAEGADAASCGSCVGRIGPSLREVELELLGSVSSAGRASLRWGSRLFLRLAGGSKVEAWSCWHADAMRATWLVRPREGTSRALERPSGGCRGRSFWSDGAGCGSDGLAKPR